MSAREVRDGQLGLAHRLGLTARPSCVFAFVSPRCDLDAVGVELRALGVPVIACTTAGQIGRTGFEHGDVSAAAVFDSDLEVHSFPIDSFVDLERSVARTAAHVIISGVLDRSDVSIFGLVLVDGLSGIEERLMEALNRRLPLLPMVGGSAGDELAFARTHVYVDGAFRTGAAVLHIVATSRRVVPLKLQHHVPTESRLVVTAASTATRTLMELNGRPAAEAYAELLGVSRDALGDALMAKHPLMLRVGRETYTRSIRRVLPDGSLQLFCAIERGIVLRLGRSEGVVETLKDALDEGAARVGRPALVVGCDCVLRRLEIERENLVDDVGSILSSHNVIGFSTYGEQFNAVHANQTFTGIMIGERR